jgi:predicted RNase H-like HicB family nuclease
MHIQSVTDQRHTDQDQKTQRENLDRRMLLDKCADFSGKEHHEADRRYHRDHNGSSIPDGPNRALRRIRGDIMKKQLTAIIAREGGGYVSLCPELDIASQGATIEEARDNLQEALELFFETASPAELQARLHEEVYVTRVEIAVG